LAATVVAGLFVGASAAAAPGHLDPPFGVNGMVRTDLRVLDVTNAVALQQDGKIIAVAMAADATGVSDFALARCETTGAQQ